MGRVGRYKRTKSTDLSHKRKRDDKKSIEFNLPPGVRNHQAQRLDAEGEVKRRKKQRLPQWAVDELKETAKQEREAVLLGKDTLSTGGRETSERKQTKVIEPKRANESLKEFNKRLKTETAVALLDEAKRNSSSLKRRSTFLKDKDKKKKLQKAGLWEEHQAIKAREESGLEEREFAKPESIRFGETVDQPPRFKTVPKMKVAKNRQLGKPWLLAKPQGEDKDISVGMSDESQRLKRKQMDDVRAEAVLAYSELKKRRRSGKVNFAASNL